MKRSLLFALSFLMGASFAAPLNIGNAEEIFYRDILQISSFPGAPFTGNPFTDIIMVFFIPTGFLILFIHYVAAMFWQGHAKLNLLFTLMLYLFVIGSGAFQYFVGLASGYIPILLFFGGIFFVLQHFRRQTHAPAAGGGAHPQSMSAIAGSQVDYAEMDRLSLNQHKERTERFISYLNQQIKEAEANKEPRLETLRMQLVEKQQALDMIKYELSRTKGFKEFGKRF
ncbi:MAG: hypothetical protein HY365_03150 [Candidatus Aenigmarchaeota archaeon]|nr:hypothetical protein [Candidatus Aenigmarchaeota archaeon]